MQRYFMKEDYQEKDLYKVADENYHHIVRVMRMTPNDRCYLVFQNKTAILAEIVEIDSTSVYFKEISKEEMDKELPIEVTIACGLPKGDKLEWIVQSVYRLSCENFRCQMGPQKKSSQRKKITKNCHRSGGAIASAADTKCFFGGKNTRNHCAI